MLTQFSFKALLMDDCGASAVEYSLVSGSMAVALLAALPFITNGTGGIYGYITDLFE